ncbi:hypothetical protein CLAFUW4_07130 [Fulvia fulva]|uniref:Phytanoyl-CoA dioxygenase family protein n=1 Tax=Passalora fulva TaxID=5499 RepID=A0A9Q8UQY8_PASFU|nr:uncharacterized protein CLAFUR5_07264 [Fulvia fulva]KAK4621870.1 hypothetical protein CLAFUR4_07139 [Fulvia fulva]KAK4622854.1 hypothetical protein CLAFUR0_07137 [Fulvia fulva]UJO19167.1 hypothetical protein CLAFUR5_07264 [Fulvia fulva]WPV16792.1 hypothetical protein CLAFUW4_07130 [Fulvia fulva]WPV31631.1 hypothetical protein CLAFUW7_07131 [Fulvia fulva]
MASDESSTHSFHVSGEKLRAVLARDGFVRIAQAFSPEEVHPFQQACKRTVDLARAGKWPYFRTLPKQFPPWTDDVSQGIWGVQHLLHPDMPEKETFEKSHFGDTMVNAVTALLQCSRDELVLELCNMLVRPDRDFALRWHRDDMPGQVAVKMYPGDIGFYNNNILHRGVCDSKNERMTLHGTMGLVGTDTSRARNILQHGIGKWAADCGFSDLPPGMAQLADGMKQRLLAMGQGHDGGYSQQD